ncbi:hypothetical protein ABW20_dc0108625 [Dactylellina cionopaga]|nr:hypothetical protein ABW20_dc0108625 [Dactylellina cionopaga]
MRHRVALWARFAPLPEHITEASLIATLPEKHKKKKYTPRHPPHRIVKTVPNDDVGSLTREANPLGSHIYFYHHLLSKRVIYSLYQNLYNNKAMKQISFMGKKTVPAALRKDMWTPFLTASFSNSQTGLRAFQHLRELRKLHETQWDLKLMKMPVKLRSKTLQDQRANSIADLAAICTKDVKTEESVRLRWRDIYDAEYAAEWPRSVVHDVETQKDIRFQARRMGKYEPGADGEMTAIKSIEAAPEEGLVEAETKPETEVQSEPARKFPLSFWR